MDLHSVLRQAKQQLRSIAIMAIGVGILFAPAILTAAVHSHTGKLQVYVIDVEGGQSTLFVTPSSQSLLVDTGWPGHEGRDAGRIVAAAKQAGLSRIDFVLITHFHQDHVGGVPQLLARIPVGTFIDHGPNRETTTPATERGWEAYRKVLATGKYKHFVATPGDVLPIRGLHVEVVSGDGKLIQKPLPGGGEQNPYCAESEKRAADQTENARSLGLFMTFGKVKLLDLGDLTWDKEMELMCPANKLGHVDVLIVSHHGWYQSSSPALVDAITPVVAIMDNGETKGGSTPTLETIRAIPGLKTLWQLHYSDEGGPQHNAPAPYIANLEGTDMKNTDAGNYFKVTVSKDGAFSVWNSRTQLAKHYQATH